MNDINRREFLLGAAVAVSTILGSRVSSVEVSKTDEFVEPEIIWDRDARDVAISLNDTDKLAFSSNGWVYTMDLSNRETRLLASEHRCEHPTWSPNGDYLVYSAYLEKNYKIAIVGADGNHKRYIADDLLYPSWSPTQNKILATSPNRDLFLLVENAENWERVPIGQGSNPVWSPDGQRFAFETSRDGNAEIYIADADGSNQVNITNNDRADYAPTWFPDGNSLIVDSNRDATTAPYNRDYNLYKVDLSDYSTERLTESVGVDAFSAISQGGKIAYIANATDEIVLFGNPTLLTNNGPKILSDGRCRKVHWQNEEYLILEGYRGKLARISTYVYRQYMPNIQQNG